MPVHKISFAVALAEFGLNPATVVSRETVRRCYRELALQHHPDKVRARGGDADVATARFQRICEAYRVLQDNCPDAQCLDGVQTSTSRTTSAAPARSNCCYGAYSFTASVASNNPTAASSDGAARSPISTASASASTNGSAGASVPPGQCVTCGKEKLLITEVRAESLGIMWAEYSNHPGGLQTCMLCKMAQRSVLTEGHAMKVFPMLQGRPSTFEQLRKQKRSFTINSIPHYWRPDLEKAHMHASGTAAASHTVRTGDTAGGVATPVASGCAPAAGHENEFAMDKTTPVKTKQPSNRNVRDTLVHEAAKECFDPPVRETAKDGCNTGRFQKENTATLTGPWTYQVIGNNKVGIRKKPCITDEASPCGHLPSGSIFVVSDRIRGTDGRMYLKLADGRGWTYNLSAKDPNKIVVMELSTSLEKALFVGARASGTGEDGVKRKRKERDKEEKNDAKKAKQ